MRNNFGDKIGTVIGPGSTVEGVLEIDHPIRVDGLLRGRLTTPSALVVGENGWVDGEVLVVSEAIVNGRLTGNLKATMQVFLAAGSEFRGTVETPRLVIEEGATAEFNPEIGGQTGTELFSGSGPRSSGNGPVQGGDTGPPQEEEAAGVGGDPPERDV